MSEPENFKSRQVWNGEDAEFWAGTASGIAKALAIFPVALVTFVIIQDGLSNSGIELSRLIGAILGASIIAFMTHFFALILASVFGILCDKILSAWETNSRELWVGAFIGGMVSITLTIPFVLATLLQTQSFELNNNNLWMIAFVTMAILLGQAGAIFGGRRWLESKRTREDWIASLPRFSMATLMWLSLGICAMLGVLKYYRLDALLAYAVVCLVAQLITMTLLLLLERFIFQNPVTPTD
jgi:hypothetical protein